MAGQNYYHRNRQYSISALTDNSGAVFERYSYDAYGNTTILHPNGSTVRTNSSAGNYFMYTGRFNQVELGLHYFRARWYDPALGRFISRDPLGFVDGMSLYRGYFVPEGVDPSGSFYGRYCGPFNKGGGGIPGWDDLDDACAVHDKCLNTWREVINPGKRQSCNAALCEASSKLTICDTSRSKASCIAAAATIQIAVCGPFAGFCFK
jgi:RHS repeat-associated protein